MIPDPGLNNPGFRSTFQTKDLWSSTPVRLVARLPPTIAHRSKRCVPRLARPRRCIEDLSPRPKNGIFALKKQLYPWSLSTDPGSPANLPWGPTASFPWWVTLASCTFEALIALGSQSVLPGRRDLSGRLEVVGGVPCRRLGFSDRFRETTSLASSVYKGLMENGRRWDRC